MNLKRDFESWN